jgi:hypothetical protein
MTHIFQPKANWKLQGPMPGNPLCNWYQWGDCRVFVGLEPAGWHLSISHPNRNPTWEEIKQARYDFCPHDVTMAMILPPTTEYVNIHNFCFHLHQIPNEGEE